MSFLLAQIAIFLVLAALFGAALMWFFLRRRYEDVTERYAFLEGEIDDRGRQLELYNSIEDRLGSLVPTPTDLTPLSRRLNDVEARIEGVRAAQPDMSKLDSQLAAIDLELTSLKLPEVDLSPLNERLDAIETRLTNSRPPKANIAGVESKLATIEAKLSSMRGAEEESLTAVFQWVEGAVGAMRCPDVDLAPLIQRLDRLEAKLFEPSTPEEAPLTETETFEEVRKQDGSKNLLTRAAFGAPDDLKRISGVGPVLERMLHRLGVYYFWQVAEWTPEDVQFVDDQLTAFKGRIERDTWVSQAIQLAKSPGAAPPPETRAASPSPGAEGPNEGVETSPEL